MLAIFNVLDFLLHRLRVLPEVSPDTFAWQSRHLVLEEASQDVNPGLTLQFFGLLTRVNQPSICD